MLDFTDHRQSCATLLQPVTSALNPYSPCAQAMGYALSLIALLGVVETSCLEVGFCEDGGDSFFASQPESQLERWQLPYDNGSHLVIRWRPDHQLNGRNVTAYLVDVRTSAPVLNLFVGVYGGFPQDLCAPGGSKARAAVSVSDSKSSCGPYPARASSIEYLTSFEIPGTLRQLAQWDITVTARGYGSHAPSGHPELGRAAVFWCHKYRRSRHAATAASNQGSSSAPPVWARALHWVRKLGHRISRDCGRLVRSIALGGAASRAGGGSFAPQQSRGSKTCAHSPVNHPDTQPTSWFMSLWPSALLDEYLHPSRLASVFGWSRVGSY